MKDFYRTSKALRVTLLLSIVSAMSEDPAVRFAYYHTLNDRMNDVLDDLNYPKGERGVFDQIKMLNVILGDETAVIKQHLVDAVKFLQEAGDTGEFKAGVSAERREWFQPPRVNSFTLSIGDVSKTFTDNGEVYTEG